MSEGLLDRPRRPRAEDCEGMEQICAWLGHELGLSGSPQVEQFRGGASNLTFLLSWPGRELILRRPPAGHRARGAHDMGREVRVLQALRPHYPCAPEVLAWCSDEAVAGVEFYAMARIGGLILRQDLPPELGLDEATTRRLCHAVLDKLVELHSLDVQACGLSGLGRGQGYVKRQVEGWSRRYRAALTPGASPAEGLMDWLARRMPAESPGRMVHGDFRLDNVVLDPRDPCRVIGVLDWEMSTVGDPLLDLGSSLAYWVDPEDDLVFQMMRRQPTQAPGMLRRAEVWERWGQQSGRPVLPEERLWYEVFGLFRLAVILQQIWYRYHHGQTTNPAFAAFGDLAVYLVQRGRQLVGEAGEVVDG
jgi:aminoglycoside phosphotransferase (APT) family kinase protein